jgi:hypothetical protein
MTHDSVRAQLSREAMSEVIGHMTESKSTSAGRRGPESYDMWQRWSPTQPGGEVQSHRTRGNVGAHLNQEVMYDAVRHVAALEPTSVKKRGLKP